MKSAMCAFAILVIARCSSAFAVDGYATIGGDTTGGQAGPTVTVTNEVDFTKYAKTNLPYVVQVAGTIITNIVSVRSDKTLIGLGTNATFIGRLNLSSGVSNIVVRNLFITNPTGGDGITIDSASHHIWVDHCTFFDCSDGEVDITVASDFVTVSWCKFFYTFNSGHNFVNLIGASDGDVGDSNKLHVTFHHNWWSTLCVERMPRVRYGRVHVYNNYYNASVSNNIVNNYCVAASTQSEVLVEKNVFQRVDEPYRYQSPPGLMRAVSNATINCTGVASFNDSVFAPPYAYTMDETNLVADIVTNNAGAGKLDLNLPVALFTASPTNGFEPLAVTFTDTSTGTEPISLSWDLGDSTTTNTAGGTNFTHAYAAGTYTVTLTASNSVGTSTLVSNNLITVITAFQAWQFQYFNCTNCAQAAGNADPDGDGQNNQAEFLSGTNPTNSLSGLRIISAVRQTTDVVITWTTAGGFTNVVQATAGDGNGGYTTNFADLSGPLTISGTGDVTTNYVDSGGVTNGPALYYRIRLVP